MSYTWTQGVDWEAVEAAFEVHYGSFRKYLGCDEADPEGLLQFLIEKGLVSESIEALEQEGQELLRISRIRAGRENIRRLKGYLADRDSWTTSYFVEQPEGMPTALMAEIRERPMTAEEKEAEDKRIRGFIVDAEARQVVLGTEATE